MTRRMKRREALANVARLSTAVVLPGWRLACSKKPNCNDVSTLSTDDVRIRNEVAKYVDQTMEASKRCSACLQYVPAAPNQCGGCKVVKGPINPDGNCTLFVLRSS